MNPLMSILNMVQQTKPLPLYHNITHIDYLMKAYPLSSPITITCSTAIPKVVDYVAAPLP